MPQPRFVLPPWRKPATILTFGLLLLMAAGQERVLAQVEPCERDPEPKISLSAGAIVEILRREPGLLLEVKRLLVRKAYEQGRLLDPADLTDDALFQLLKEDDNVRVLATQEIENREYVRPKPTRREMERQRIGRLPSGESAKAAGSGASPAVPSEEEKYWEQHDRQSAQQKTIATPGSGADSRADDDVAEMASQKMGSQKMDSRLSRPPLAIRCRRNPLSRFLPTPAAGRVWLACSLKIGIPTPEPLKPAHCRALVPKACRDC